MFDPQHLLRWIMVNIETQGFDRYDDLHLDDLARDYAHVSTWIPGIEDVMAALDRYRDAVPSEYRVAVGLSLRSTNTPLGITFDSLDELCSEFTETPPSVYVFKRGDEPWKRFPKNAVALPQPLPQRMTGQCEVIHFEYREENEREYRRSLWWLPCR